MNLINLKIVTPNGVKFDRKIEIFNTKTANGSIGINANRLGMIAKMSNCISSIKIDSANVIDVVILNGFMYSTKDKIEVFTDYYEEVKNIDVNNIKHELAQLQQQLNDKDISPNIIDTLNFKIQRLQKILDCFVNKS